MGGQINTMREYVLLIREWQAASKTQYSETDVEILRNMRLFMEGYLSIGRVRSLPKRVDPRIVTFMLGPFSDLKRFIDSHSADYWKNLKATSREAYESDASERREIIERVRLHRSELYGKGAIYEHKDWRINDPDKYPAWRGDTRARAQELEAQAEAEAQTAEAFEKGTEYTYC